MLTLLVIFVGIISIANAGGETLVLLDNLAIKETHSMFFKSLQGLFFIVNSINCAGFCECVYVKWSVVRIETGRTAGVQFPAGVRNFALRCSIHTGSRHHVVSHIMVTGTFPVGLRRPRLEPDHSPPSSIGVKNGGAVSSLPYIMSRCLIKYMANFILMLEDAYFIC
jgi:hypothetical protein